MAIFEDCDGSIKLNIKLSFISSHRLINLRVRMDIILLSLECSFGAREDIYSFRSKNVFSVENRE